MNERDPLYYFTKAEYAVQNICRGRIKVSRFFELNDPFELLAGEQTDRSFRRRMQAWTKTINDDKGLLCLTTNWKNPLMWSHYGDKHRGICLGFAVAGSRAINYNGDRLPIEEWKRTRSDEPPTDFERRVIVTLKDLENDNGLYFKPFDESLRLVQVIAGARCCLKWKAAILDAVDKLPERPELSN